MRIIRKGRAESQAARMRGFAHSRLPRTKAKNIKSSVLQICLAKRIRSEIVKKNKVQFFRFVYIIFPVVIHSRSTLSNLLILAYITV